MKILPRPENHEDPKLFTSLKKQRDGVINICFPILEQSI